MIGMSETKKVVDTTAGTKIERKLSYRERIKRHGWDLPVKDFCEDYGWTTRQMNKWLKDHEVQYRIEGLWVLCDGLKNRGYMYTDYVTYTGRTGLIYPNIQQYWTPAGQIFLYDFLKAHGILPLEERQEESAYA